MASKPTTATIRPCISLEVIGDVRIVRPDLKHVSDKGLIERALVFFADNTSVRSNIPGFLSKTVDSHAALDAQAQPTHQQTQEPHNDRSANVERPAAVDQQCPAALVAPTPAPEQQFFDILDIDDDDD